MKKKYSTYQFEAALDEVGRGCLAGPVVAAAVILPADFYHKDINDSKKLSPKKRKELGAIIKDNCLSYSIAEVPSKKIDEINILNASFLAMHIAIEKLSIVPEFLLIDGNRFNPYRDIPHFCAIKGDANFLNIASASILAKNYRDSLMEKLHEKFPNYYWNKNMGYPTIQHRKAIQEFGITNFHRKSFNLFPIQLSLEL